MHRATGRAVARALCASLLALGVWRPARAQSSLGDQFRVLLHARYTALAAADTATLRPQLADDLVWVSGVNGTTATKAQLLALAGTPQTPSPRFEVDSVRALRVGNVALVDYRRSDHRPLGTGELVTRWRVLDVFVSRAGRWVWERHTQTWVVTPVTAIATDSAALQPFVGRYRIAPGYVDNVHWEHGALVATASGQTAGARLVPVSSSAFSPDGVGSLIVFERDAAGRVLGYVQGYPDGTVFRAARLP